MMWLLSAALAAPCDLGTLELSSERGWCVEGESVTYTATVPACEGFDLDYNWGSDADEGFSGSEPEVTLVCPAVACPGKTFHVYVIITLDGNQDWRDEKLAVLCKAAVGEVDPDDVPPSECPTGCADGCASDADSRDTAPLAPFDTGTTWNNGENPPCEAADVDGWREEVQCAEGGLPAFGPNRCDDSALTVRWSSADGPLGETQGFALPSPCPEITCPARDDTLSFEVTDAAGGTATGTVRRTTLCEAYAEPAPCPTCAGGLPTLLGLLPAALWRRRRSG